MGQESNRETQRWNRVEAETPVQPALLLAHGRLLQSSVAALLVLNLQDRQARITKQICSAGGERKSSLQTECVAAEETELYPGVVFLTTALPGVVTWQRCGGTRRCGGSSVGGLASHALLEGWNDGLLPL